MKIYSLLIICMTLGVFYGLAVQEENNRNDKNTEIHVSKIALIEENLESENIHFSTSEDEFANYVTGKEHMYLNTGISYIVEEYEALEVLQTNQCIAENSKDESEANLGS